MHHDFPSLARTIGELDAGNLESMASHALRDVALAVRDTPDRNKKGKIVIEMTFEQTKGTAQLLVTHKLKYSRPTESGRIQEESSGDTQLYVGKGGSLSIVPEAQGKFDFNDKTEGVHP